MPTRTKAGTDRRDAAPEPPFGSGRFLSEARASGALLISRARKSRCLSRRLPALSRSDFRRRHDDYRLASAARCCRTPHASHLNRSGAFLFPKPIKLNSEDTKMRSGAERIWKAGKQEKHCFGPASRPSGSAVPTFALSLLPFPMNMDREDAKMRSEAKRIWKAGRQEENCFGPAFLLSRFKFFVFFAPPHLRY